MLKIKLTTPDGSKLGFDVDFERATIGRADDNDIVVPDGSVSSRHGEILRKGDSVELVDLGSTNGTHFGGQRVERATLTPGATFKLGSVEGVLLGDAPPAAPAESGTAPAAAEAESSAPSSAPAEEAAPAPTWSGAPAPGAAIATGLGATPCPVRQRSGFGAKTKAADKSAGMLMTLAVVSLLVCGAAAFLVFRMVA